MNTKKQSIIQMIGLICFVTLLTIFVQYVTQNIRADATDLNQGWNVWINDTLYADVNLDKLLFPMTQAGDKVVLTRKLPETDYLQTTLQFHSNQSVVHIYLDGEIICEYGSAYHAQHKMVGSGYLWAALPEDCANKEIRIELEVTEDEAFNYINPIYLEQTQSIYYNLIASNLVTAFVSAFLFCAGCISIVIAIAMYYSDKRMKVLAWIAFFTISVSQWMLAYSRLIQLLTKNFHLISQLEYLSLYFAPVCMLGFIHDMVTGKKFQRIIEILSTIYGGGITGLIVLNYTNVAHFSTTVGIFHIMGLILIIFAVVINILCRRRDVSQANRMFLFGLIMLALFGLAEVIRYWFGKLGPLWFGARQSFLPIGLLFFVICMIMSFFIKMMERVAANMERKTLLEMAYTDSLTNIKNRAVCEEVLGQYELSEKPVTIINMDLNLFKKVNDTYGHAVGDELLMRFAQILQNTFDGVGQVGRMGGDEFIVIMDYRERQLVEQIMQELIYRVQEANLVSGRPYDMSVSYGIADNAGDTGITAWKVYEQADMNMYEYKKTQKENRRV